MRGPVHGWSLPVCNLVPFCYCTPTATSSARQAHAQMHQLQTVGSMRTRTLISRIWSPDEQACPAHAQTSACECRLINTAAPLCDTLPTAACVHLASIQESASHLSHRLSVLSSPLSGTSACPSPSPLSPVSRQDLPSPGKACTDQAHSIEALQHRVDELTELVHRQQGSQAPKANDVDSMGSGGGAEQYHGTPSAQFFSRLFF